MILAAVGKNASGKDYFLEYISKKYNIPMFSIGDIARDLAEEEGLEKTRDNLHKISQKYMSKYGNGFFPQKLIEKIKASGVKNVLVSGIRPPSDINAFKEAFGDDFILVAIIVPDDTIRYRRTVSRGSERDRISYEKFLELDQHEEELFATSKSIELANFKIDNGERSSEEYHAIIDEFFTKNILPRV